MFFFFSSRRRHTRCSRDWSSDVCSSDLAVGVGARLAPFLPIPLVGKDGERYRWLTEADVPQSIGRLSAFMGNTGVLLRAYIYMRMLGREGMQRVGGDAPLNANYLLARLQAH